MVTMLRYTSHPIRLASLSTGRRKKVAHTNKTPREAHHNHTFPCAILRLNLKIQMTGLEVPRSYARGNRDDKSMDMCLVHIFDSHTYVHAHGHCRIIRIPQPLRARAAETFVRSCDLPISACRNCTRNCAKCALRTAHTTLTTEMRTEEKTKSGVPVKKAERSGNECALR